MTCNSKIGTGFCSELSFEYLVEWKFLYFWPIFGAGSFCFCMQSTNWIVWSHTPCLVNVRITVLGKNEWWAEFVNNIHEFILRCVRSLFRLQLISCYGKPSACIMAAYSTRTGPYVMFFFVFKACSYRFIVLYCTVLSCLAAYACCLVINF